MKSYTDLNQSKKLAEFLPLESADQTWECIAICGANLDVPEELQYRHNGDMLFSCHSGIGIPCWSLAALLGVLEHPRCFQGDKPIYWFCGCFGKDNLYHEVEADNPVDACVEMIIRLNKLNLL